MKKKQQLNQQEVAELIAEAGRRLRLEGQQAEEWRGLRFPPPAPPRPPQQFRVYNQWAQEAAPAPPAAAPPAGGAGQVVIRDEVAPAPAAPRGGAGPWEERYDVAMAEAAPINQAPPRAKGPGLELAIQNYLYGGNPGQQVAEAPRREGHNLRGAQQIAHENQVALDWGDPPVNPNPPVEARQPEVNLPAAGGGNYPPGYQQYVVMEANVPGQRYQAVPGGVLYYRNVPQAAPARDEGQEAPNEVEEMPKLEGNPVDLDHLFGTTANRIESIGIEVEGAWAKPPKMGYQAIHADASVFKNVVLPVVYDAKGEIASPPLIPAAKGKWLVENYPIYTDSTCGLHIHMKFKKAHYYSLLMDSPDYQATLLAYLTKWAKEEGFPPDHCIWSRLAGKNKYCKPDYWPDLQVLQKVKPRNVEAVAGTTGHRYTICNFCWGLGNQTMEVRVLPMMKDAVTANRALDVIIKVTNAYIRAMLPKNQKDREQYRKSLTASCKIVLEEDDIKGTGKVQVYI